MKAYIQDSPEVNLVLKRHMYDVESQLNELVHKVLARIVEEDKYRMINAALLDSLDRKVEARLDKLQDRLDAVTSLERRQQATQLLLLGVGAVAVFGLVKSK